MSSISEIRHDLKSMTTMNPSGIDLIECEVYNKGPVSGGFVWLRRFNRDLCHLDCLKAPSNYKEGKIDAVAQEKIDKLEEELSTRKVPEGLLRDCYAVVHRLTVVQLRYLKEVPHEDNRSKPGDRSLFTARMVNGIIRDMSLILCSLDA